MLSYGGIALQIPGAEEAAFIASRIPVESAFSFFRPRFLADPALDPRPLFSWFLSRPVRINSLFMPFGASRFGHAMVLADGDMASAIALQNGSTSNALPFVVDDGLGNLISTPMYQLPAVPLSKIATFPQLPLFLLPLVDERHRWWEKSGAIDIVEGTTTWEEVYAAIATALAITLTVDPVDPAYLMPGAGLTKHYQFLPLLLDLVASSVGQRIARRLSGAFYARSATTATSLMIAQTNQQAKFAGGTLALGVVDG